MKIFDEKSQGLERALQESYYDKEHIAVNGRWKMNVMREVRQESLLEENTAWLFFINRFGWRFVAVVCVILPILFIYAGFAGFNPTDEINSLFLSNPIEFTVTQMLK